MITYDDYINNRRYPVGYRIRLRNYLRNYFNFLSIVDEGDYDAREMEEKIQLCIDKITTFLERPRLDVDTLEVFGYLIMEFQILYQKVHRKRWRLYH